MLPYAALFFLFPLGMATVRHYSSTLFVVMTLLGLWGAYHNRRGFSLPADRIRFFYGLLAFLLIISLSLISAVDPAEGFKRLSKLAYLVLLFPLYLASRNLSEKLIRYFFSGLVLAGPINLVVALYSVHFQNLSRAQGYYHPIIFGTLSLLGGMLLSVFVFSGKFKSPFATSVGTISILCMLFSSYLSGTRGAWVALPFALLVAMLLYRDRLNRKILLQMILGLVLLSSLILVQLKIESSDAIVDPRKESIVSMTYENMVSFSQGEKLNSSIGQRFLMWGVAMEMFKEKPLLGYGLGGFNDEVERRQRNGETHLEIAWSHAHSIYFEFLASTGILGFLSMVGSLFFLPALLFKRALSGTEEQKFSASAGLVCLICFAVFGLTECWLYRSPMIIAYIVCLLVFSSGCGERRAV